MKSAEQTKQRKRAKMKAKKIIKAIIIILVCAAIAYAAIKYLPQFLKKEEVSTRVVTYNVEQVTSGSVTQTISGNGTLSPVSKKTLTSSKGGEVTKVNFSVGDEVKEDDVIAVIGGKKVKAPYDGILIELPIAVDDEVAVGGSVAMIMGKDGFTMGIAVDETEIASVKLDQEVSFSIDAVSGDFTGKVSKISYNGSSSGGSVAFQITATLDYTEGVYPGMSASAQIVIEDSGEGLLVPVEAVQTSGDDNYVYLAPSGSQNGSTYGEDEIDISGLEKITVKTGMSDGSYIIVESDNLSENSLIVITKISSTATSSDEKEDERGGFGGNFPGRGNFPGGMDFGDFDFESFDPSQRPQGSGSSGGNGGFSGGGFGGRN